jgi:hypothetical protein
MTDEQMYDPEMPEGHEEMIQEAMKSVRVMNLGYSITAAFTDLNASQLRQWYVETFVLDPFNMVTLRSGVIRLEELALMKGGGRWPSNEHAAIGYRLLFELYPDAMTEWPDILNADSWRSPKYLTQYMLRLMRPWEQIRFDPEGENWYRNVSPGQWQRVGKGAPGQSMAEKWVAVWLDRMNIESNPLYDGFPPSAEKVNAMGMDQVNACLAGSIAALKKFKNTPTADATIRKLLEREPLMWLDPSTMNRIRNLTPFSNGALSLVDSRFKGNDGEEHVITMGQLLPMDSEHMVMNANSLKWNDPHGLIPAAIQSSTLPEDDFDYREMDELEDDLMFHQCPTYWSFLTHAFPEPEERSAFLRLLGAAMYGTNLKVVAAMIGEPNAGKDTVINWLNYLMPGQVANLPFSAFTPYGDEDRGFAPLMGARVATVSGEVGEGRGSKLLAEKIKTVSSGGGTLRVAEKYEKPTTIFFDGMLFLQGNSVPTIAGGDRALYENRLVAVEFKHPFKLQARNYETEYRAEAGAFAKVLFLNYVKYQHRGGGMIGINPPKSWKAFAKEFADAANPHGFIEACIVPSEDPISTSQFHAALSAMAERFGSPYKVGPNYWPKRLRALGFPLKGPGTVRRQVGQDRVYAYYLTLDAEKSEGAFTQQQWESVLQDAAVTS